MLFAYPLAAVEENWLHDCLVQLILDGFQQIDSGSELENFNWPDSIPEDYREQLRRRTGLRDRLVAFLTICSSVSAEHRLSIIKAIDTENNIPAIFDGVTECFRKNDLPEAVGISAQELFQFAFSLLADFGVRDRHYSTIAQCFDQYAMVCPFCGVEPFEAPGMAREDLDHYLPISIYPFAGVNLRNLTPMGHKCNSSYKRAVDMIVDAQNGMRRRCVDPYAGPVFNVSLLDSVPFDGEQRGNIVLPRWNLSIEGPEPEVETWLSVFNIPDRYRINILDAEFRGWLSHFANWCRTEIGNINNEIEVAAAIQRYLTVVIQEGFGERNFLKRAVFEMLHQKCFGQPYSDRLVMWFVDLVRYS